MKSEHEDDHDDRDALFSADLFLKPCHMLIHMFDSLG